MGKKLVVLAVIFVALCFAGVGCFRGGVHGGGYEGQYYDGPYRIGEVPYYYYNGGFYYHDGVAFRFQYNVPQDQRAYYDEQHRRNREHYNRDYPKWRAQHPDHPWASPR